MRRGVRKGSVLLGTCSLVVGLTLLDSCSTEGSMAAGRTARDHRFENGAVTLELALSKETITTAQDLVLTVAVAGKKGWSVTPPKVGRKIGGFTVVARNAGRPELDRSDSTRQVTTYRLEPLLPGTYFLPPLTAIGRNGRSRIEVTSNKIPVKVASLVPAGAKTPLELKGLIGPLAGPSALPEVLAGATTLFAVVGASLFSLIVRLRRRRRERVEAIPPWVRARTELDGLVELDLPNAGRHKEFYNAIGRLVRRYVEELFDINAPDQTTEEFLYSIRHSPALGRHRRSFGEFLSHCDLVKFAAYLPAQDEVHRAVRSCRAFIDSTGRDFSSQTGEGSKDR